MSKILITGGAGYIGSILTPELLKRGHEVSVIDNFLHREASLLDCCKYASFIVFRGDARNKDLMAKLIQNADFIIPLAGLVSAPSCDKDPVAAVTTNLDAVKMILELRKPDQKIIFPNTNSGYGVGREGIYCDENTPLNPISLYGKTKCEAEKAILESGNAVVFRLATVFGVSPKMRVDLLVNDFTYRAANDQFLVLFEAHFKRNYIHVRDVAGAFVFGMENFDKMKNEAYNIGLDEANLSKKELCEEIKKQLPDFYFTEGEIGKDPDKRNYIVSNAKIAKAGFRPKISLQEGISELIKCYQIVRKDRFSNN